MIKALSIRQPWAWLIVHGAKDIENRKWRTHFRGPILIHASKTIDRAAYDQLADEGIALPPIDELQTGGIIGRAEIADCVAESDSPWFAGPFGFKLRNAEPLNFCPCRGRLFFFQPDHLEIS
jgi:hypothetical protein